VRHIVLWRLKQPDETDFARIRAVVDPLIAEHWSLTTTYQILTSMRAAKK
jgi:hypothetical protein